MLFCLLVVLSGLLKSHLFQFLLLFSLLLILLLWFFTMKRVIQWLTCRTERMVQWLFLFFCTFNLLLFFWTFYIFLFGLAFPKQIKHLGSIHNQIILACLQWIQYSLLMHFLFILLYLKPRTRQIFCLILQITFKIFTAKKWIFFRWHIL